MRRGLNATVLAGAVLLGVAPAMAEGVVPDLLGTWSGTYKLIRWDGPAEGVMEFRFIAQDGALLKAEKAWAIDDGGTPGSVEGKLVMDAVEPMVGVIDFDGEHFYLAEQGDGGVYHGRLADPDTMEVLYFEPGDQATAYRMTLRRGE